MDANFICRSDVTVISNTWSTSTPGTKDNMCTSETRCRHAIENQDKDLATVQALELKVGIAKCWTGGSAECHEAATLLHMHKYQRALWWPVCLSGARGTAHNQVHLPRLIYSSPALNEPYCRAIVFKNIHIGQALQKCSSAI